MYSSVSMSGTQLLVYTYIKCTLKGCLFVQQCMKVWLWCTEIAYMYALVSEGNNDNLRTSVL